MNENTPSEDEVRSAWVWLDEHEWHKDPTESAAEFARFVASVKAEAERRGLERGWDQGHAEALAYGEVFERNPYRAEGEQK